jgi:hypothetical protein
VKPSALKREHPALQKLKFINCFLFVFSIVNPYPVQMRIRNQNTAKKKTRFNSSKHVVTKGTQLSGSAEKSKHDDRTRPTAGYMCTHAAAAVHKHKQPQ